MADIQTRIERVRDRYEVQVLKGDFWNPVQSVQKRITAAQIVQEIKRGNYHFDERPKLYGVAPEDSRMHKSTFPTVIQEVRAYFKKNKNALVLCKDIVLGIGDDDKRVSSVMHKLVVNGELRRIANSPTISSFRYGLPHMILTGDFKQRILEVLQEYPEGLNIRALLFHIGIHCPPTYRQCIEDLVTLGLIKRIPNNKKAIYVIRN